MKLLYDLPEEYKKLFAMMEDEEVDSEFLKSALDGIEGEIEEKAEECMKIYTMLNSEGIYICGEIDRLSNRDKILAKNAYNLVEVLRQHILGTKKRTFRTPLFNFIVKKKPPKLVIDQKDKIPKDFLIEQEPMVDRTGLIEYLKDNSADFAHLEWGEIVSVE